MDVDGPHNGDFPLCAKFIRQEQMKYPILAKVILTDNYNKASFTIDRQHHEVIMFKDKIYIPRNLTSRTIE